MRISSALIVFFLYEFCQCDIYLHNPRGSNNRLDEAKRNRQNANRLFDSQNNERGGYNVGGLYYYSKSRLHIEWTNQHSCANENNNCELILQYMCGDSIRDGTTTGTIPESKSYCQNANCNTDFRFGMHETFDSYQKCVNYERNKGLFLADQKLKANTARFTRQNPNGQRRGYECPEERDYYPYWRSSPWKDIAVLTNNASRCRYYQKESYNVKSRWECQVPSNWLYYLNNLITRGSGRRFRDSFPVPLTKTSCEKFNPLNHPNETARWVEVPAHGIPAPECREPEWTRDNHLGNTMGGQMPSFNWTLPEVSSRQNCVLRVRYNISSADYSDWNENKLSPPRDTVAANKQVASRVGFKSHTLASDRGYLWKNNPNVKPFQDVNLQLQLAINTAQLGRTFQDRSHIFEIRPRPDDITADDPIHNWNVRGKRGNIVQVYPSVEYDFVPNTLQFTAGDLLHLQWTGSNTNDNQLDGQGRAGTDRSNVVLQAERIYLEGNQQVLDSGVQLGSWGRSYPKQNFTSSSSLLGFSKEDLGKLAVSSAEIGGFMGEMSELDDAAPYYDHGLRKVTRTGVFHVMCTRNNNFSNRSQKGRFICSLTRREVFAVGVNGGSLKLEDGSFVVEVAPGSLTKLRKYALTRTPRTILDKKLKTKSKPPGDGYASDFYSLESEGGVSGQVKLQVLVDTASSSSVLLYRADPRTYSNWERVKADTKSSKGKKYLLFVSQVDGMFVAREVPRGHGWVIGLCIGLLAAIVLVVAAIIYFRRNPDVIARIQNHLSANNARPKRADSTDNMINM